VKRGDTCWGRRRWGRRATHETDDDDDDDASSAAARCGALTCIGVKETWQQGQQASVLGRRWFSGFSAAAPPKRRMDGLDEPPVWNAERQKGWLADKSAAIS
jgi:hypothetical protein